MVEVHRYDFVKLHIKRLLLFLDEINKFKPNKYFEVKAILMVQIKI